MEDIPAGASGRMLVLGFTAIKCINPPAVNAAGAMVTGSATAGSVTSSTTTLSGATVGTAMGTILVPAGTAGSQSGSLTQLIAKLGSGL
jgi:hypothetical protein